MISWPAQKILVAGLMVSAFGCDAFSDVVTAAVEERGGNGANPRVCFDGPDGGVLPVANCENARCYQGGQAPRQTTSSVVVAGDPALASYAGIAAEAAAFGTPLDPDTLNPAASWIVVTEGRGCFECAPVETGSVRFRYGLVGGAAATISDFRCDIVRPSVQVDAASALSTCAQGLNLPDVGGTVIWSETTLVDKSAMAACPAEWCRQQNTFVRDRDDDGVGDICDNCVDTPNPDQTNRAGGHWGDVCEDSDGDGQRDDQDNCPDSNTPPQPDLDGDGLGDICDPDRDGDGIANRDDNCPSDPNPGQADTDGDQVGDACDVCPEHAEHGDADADGDEVPDVCDNCRTVPNLGQADDDADGIGDACCGLEDPDADGINNCDHYPAGFLAARGLEPQLGAPRAHEDWGAQTPVPGMTWCDPTGFRVCMPAGTWRGDLDPAEVPGVVEALKAAGDPNVHPLIRGDDDFDLRIAQCTRICVLEGGERGCEWDLDAMNACIDSPPMAKGAIERDVGALGMGVRSSFGLMGQFVVYHLGGYSQMGCDYDLPYRITHRGRQRKGSLDIYCPPNIALEPDGIGVRGRPGQAIEVKWYHTDVNWWGNERIKSFIDQTERHHAYWKHLTTLDPNTRMIWMFGFKPPTIARRILEHDAYPFEPKMAAFPGDPQPTYPPIPHVPAYAGIADRAFPLPWLVGRIYWTQFFPTDFAEIRGVLDEGPTLDCDRDLLYCDQTGLLGAEDEPGEVTFTRRGQLYIEMPALKRWMGRYLARCVEAGPERERLGCNESLELMYDAIKGAGF